MVATITAAGGQAVANADDIATPEGAERLIAQALSAFGRVDMLVNNAGYLRDKSFSKMPLDDFEAVVRVHLMGSVYCCKAAWPVMQAQSYGRIVMTTSAAGLYGNFGQSNYAAAKLGVVGLMATLKLEGARHGIRVNAIAPVAATRMTEGTIAPDIVARTPPEMVSPAVTYLCSQACALNGEILVAGGRHFALARMVETRGITLSGSQVTPEAIAARLGEIRDLGAARPHDDALSALQATLPRLED